MPSVITAECKGEDETDNLRNVADYLAKEGCVCISGTASQDCYLRQVQSVAQCKLTHTQNAPISYIWP